MRTLTIAFVSLVALASISYVRAEQTSSCVQECRVQQKACLKNYPAATCNSEHGRCVKGCQTKQK